MSNVMRKCFIHGFPERSIIIFVTFLLLEWFPNWSLKMYMWHPIGYLVVPNHEPVYYFFKVENSVERRYRSCYKIILTKFCRLSSLRYKGLIWFRIKSYFLHSITIIYTLRNVNGGYLCTWRILYVSLLNISPWM